MKISVFTPTHDPKYILEAYASLKKQTYKDWEWIVYVNGKAIEWGLWEITGMNTDSQVKLIFASGPVRGVGEAKHIACAYAEGEILLELDHDDYLHPEALQEVHNAFENPNIGFVYSQFTQVDADSNPDLSKFNSKHGWEYTEWEYEGKKYLVPNGFEVHPHNIGYIWYAPNHLRAFRRSVYEKVGGYDRNRVLLDDQDIMAKIYKEMDFYYIKKPLYFQRIHKANTQKEPKLNKQIQSGTKFMYLNSIEDMMKIWCKRNELQAIDLGSAHGKPEGYIGIDLLDAPGVNIVGDVFQAFSKFEDGSIGLIRAVDFMEHIPDKIKFIKEVHRVLAPGGMLISMTPSTDGRGAFQDPTHCAFYNENSFWYYTRQQRKYVDELKDTQFMECYLSTEFTSKWHEENKIAYVRAYISPVKGGLRLGGLLYND